MIWSPHKSYLWFKNWKIMNDDHNREMSQSSTIAKLYNQRIFSPFSFFSEKDFLFFGIVLKDCLNIFRNAALKKLSIRFRSIDFWDYLLRLLMIIYSPRSWFKLSHQSDMHEKCDHWKNWLEKMILPLLFDVENLVVDRWTLVERFHYWKMLNR